MQDLLSSNRWSEDRSFAATSDFAFVTEANYAQLYRLALKVTRNHHDAEDALHDGIVAAYEHASELRCRTKLRSWISAVVINCARLQYRIKNRFSCSLDEPVDRDSEEQRVSMLCARGPSPEEALAAAETIDEITWRISQLSDSLQQTLVLRLIFGFSTRETAVHLGLTEKCVRVRLSRARAKMRTFLAGRRLKPSSRNVVRSL